MTMHMKNRWLGVVLTALFASACGPSTMQTLPTQQANAYSRCQTYVERSYCSKPSCAPRALEAFARQPEERRERWLVRNGCPMDLARNDG
jgi:hypothetical protein